MGKYRGKCSYDCIIPSSGGKDSYFAAHVAQECGLKGLILTYHGNNYLPEGERNLQRMRHVFKHDHIIFKPAEESLIRMNRLCFGKMGDMNWHAHCGIYTYPMQMAVKLKIPLVLYGEHGYTELGGMYSLNDFIELTAKERLEHSQRGYDWFDMIEETENLTEKDLLWAKYPTDEELYENDIRGIFLNNYFPWDGNRNADISRTYGWEEAQQPFERTYRKISNIDDMHENGIHDYLKFVKFGYGRATDHSCKDIRLGLLTREQGIEMVRKYDSVKPRRDLDRWLKYVNMTEDEFDRIADTFRDPRVWRREGERWVKDNIWDTTDSNQV